VAAGYGVAIAAAAYTQPYAASIALAHAIWSFRYGDRRTVAYGSAAAVLGCASFVPWFWSAHAMWAQGLAAADWKGALSLRTPLVLLREMAGAGYWGSGLLLILCVPALLSNRLPKPARVLLLMLIAVPIGAGLAGDSVFGYFQSARQFLWVLPAIALLAGSTWTESLLARVLLCGLFVVCVWFDVRFYSDPHEDWERAAHALRMSAGRGACIAVAPLGGAAVYEFFEPGLVTAAGSCTRLVLAVTPYATREQRSSALAGFSEEGYRAVKEPQIRRGRPSEK
jgi:hypothetical protein